MNRPPRTRHGAPPSLRRDVTFWRRVVASTMAVLLLAVIAKADGLHETLVALTEVAAPLMRSHPVAGAVVFTLVSALSAMLAFFSSAVLVPVAVQAWGMWGTAALLWVGWIVGGVGAYALARLAGRALVATLVSAESLRRYERKITAHAPFGLVLLFQLGLPSEVPGYLLGLARYSLPRYLAALALAELPWAILTVLLGTTLLSRRVTVLVAVGAVSVLLSGWAFWALQRRLRVGPARHARAGGAGTGAGPSASATATTAASSPAASDRS